MVSLYIINCSASNSYYVGISNNPDHRWKSHIWNAYSSNRKRNSLPLQKAIRKYGANRCTFKILQSFNNRDDACQAEIDTIKFMREMGFKLYNLTEGGDSYSLSAERKALVFNDVWRTRMSKMNSGSGNPMFGKRFWGKDNPNFGKPMKSHVKAALLKRNKKLLNHQIIEIKNSFMEGISQTSLARKYKVSLTTVHRAVRDKTRVGGIDLVLKPQIKAEDVVQIRTHYVNKTKTVKELEKEFNLAESHIKNIVRGRKWKSAGGPITTAESELVMNDKDVIEIRKLWETGNYTKAFLAKKFNISKKYAGDILNRKSRLNL